MPPALGGAVPAGTQLCKIRPRKYSRGFFVPARHHASFATARQLTQGSSSQLTPSYRQKSHGVQLSNLASSSIRRAFAILSFERYDDFSARKVLHIAQLTQLSLQTMSGYGHPFGRSFILSCTLPFGRPVRRPELPAPALALTPAFLPAITHPALTQRSAAPDVAAAQARVRRSRRPPPH